ncbi:MULTISPECIES: DUF362 domain-containing protein [Thermoanaerobacterium]|uniref:DUF362 domain-containing protein n=2 Tax=Thermoanaerobacterium TaxID=28895 RepID=W9E991_9THEO|nr:MULTISPECIES: DUF362 domain-containing protein [Thermoanaerobacterium]AFK86402.1 protein of unknown function DUF362 [Thermoanaerobacterium saccharolyticum JW/SL-YS485]ETO38498.1 hypothetical protein V518_1368 [Thermoanaerobacterium aotearoense SCUT27]
MRYRKIVEPVVAITSGPDEIQNLNTALNLLPLQNLIETGNTVVITPNFVKSKPPQSGTIVGPNTLRALIRYVKSKNPGRIVIAAGSGGDPTPKVLSDNGFDKVISEEGVEFVDLNYGPYVELLLDDCLLKSTKVNELYEKMDVLISFTQMKMHEEATVSLGIKNIALSWPPAEIHGFPKKNLGIHDDLHNFIRAMAEKISIDLTILSGQEAMIGTGPSEGKPINANMIIAGTDPVATDTVGARMFGLMPQGVNYLFQCAKRGVGTGELKNVTIKGIPLQQAELNFSTIAYGYGIALDSSGIKQMVPGKA